MSQKILKALSLTAALLTLNLPATSFAQSKQQPKQELYKFLDAFGDVLDRVRSDYVEKPDDRKLIEGAINGMMKTLDPHSKYYPPAKLRDTSKTMRGKFGGFGIEVAMENGVVKVVVPIEDSPADKAGLRSGDLITHVDSKPVRGLSLAEAVQRMRGKVGTKSTITIVRKGRPKPFEATITRAEIKVVSVKSRPEGDVGYLRVTAFNEQTLPSLKRQIKSLKQKIGSKPKGYILDLRNCPGGLFSVTVALADEFLDDGEIVQLRGRAKFSTIRHTAKKGDIIYGKKLVVLINGGTSSGAEILAGALKDHRRATVIGTRTYGNGTVQTIIPIKSLGGAIRMTTARYYTPSGHAIQAQGVAPHIFIEQVLPEDLKTSKAISETSLKGYLKGEGTREKSGSSAYVPKDRSKDTQIRYALDLLRGVVGTPPAGSKPKSSDLEDLERLD